MRTKYFRDYETSADFFEGLFNLIFSKIKLMRLVRADSDKYPTKTL